MYGGMTRNELRGLTALVLLIALGLGAQTYLRGRQAGLIWEEIPVTASTQKENPPTVATQISPLDINRASTAELENIPGVGVTRAKAIVDTRERLGAFHAIEELVQVPGIGEKTLERLRPLLFADDTPTTVSQKRTAETAPPLPSPTPPLMPVAVSAPSTSTSAAVAAPIDINTASEEQLQALWNVGPATARKIVEWRRTHGPFRRPEDIIRVKGIGPKTFERNRERIRASIPSPRPTNTRPADKP